MVQQLDKKKRQRGEDHLSKEENVQQHIEPESTDARVVEIDEQF
jgi:hypothetical protein